VYGALQKFSRHHDFVAQSPHTIEGNWFERLPAIRRPPTFHGGGPPWPVGSRLEVATENMNVDVKDIYLQSTRHFLGPILPLLDDPSVSEILINGPDTIFFERAGRLIRSEFSFPSQAVLMAAARNIAEYSGRAIDEDNHSMDARLPDGSRVHAIIPPSSRSGVCLSVRKFNRSTFDLDQLVQWGSLTDELREFLALAVLLHRNIVIAGGTGSGKTSLLNALSAEIPESERIVVIEDSSELQLRQPHAIYLEAQPARPEGGGAVTIRDLFVDSLRMRPDRIVVGEVRRGEALDLIQSMISGHAGAMTTVHATTARDAAIRLETLSLMSDVAIPAHVARIQVASAVQLVVQIARCRDGSRKIQAVSECLGTDQNGEYLFQDLYRLTSSGLDGEGRLVGAVEPTGIRPTFADLPWRMGYGDRVQLTKHLFPPPSP
jgi:pilus assembly protein CpaF